MAHPAQALRFAFLLLFPALCLAGSSDYENAMARLKEGRPAEALPLLEAARAHQPGDPDILYNLAGCYFALNRPDEGARTAEELARRNSQDPAVLLASATLLAEHGSPAKAATILTNADTLAPGNPLVLNALAAAQFKAGDGAAAAASLERLLANLHSTLTPETRATLAKASQTASALHSGDPSSLRLGMLAAQFDLTADRPKEAWEILRPLEASAKSNPEYYKLLGLACLRLDRLPEAVRAGQHALQLAPNRQDLLLNLAGAFQKSRDNQAAIRLLQDAVRQGAASPEIYFALALSQFNFGSYEEAVRSCDRALSLDSKFDRAALLKGRALVKLSRRQEAIEWLGRAIEMNPACEYCRYELASTFIAENRLSEAEPLLRQVVAATPSNATAQFELGKLLNARGNTAGALTALEASVAANSDQDDAWYLIGRIYQRKGDRVKAEHALAAVKEIKDRRRRAAEQHLGSATKSGEALTPAQP